MTDDKPYADEGTLRELYHGQGMSAIEMAERFGVSDTTIRNYMERCGIERRKAYNDPSRPPAHVLDPHGDGVGNSYEKIRTYDDGERHVVLVHRLIAYAHEMLSFEDLCNPDVEIHHKSGHGLDNRPENLEVKTTTEHSKNHADERYGDGGWRDKERLKELLEQGTQKEAAERLGCSERTVYVWKNKHGLE